MGEQRVHRPAVRARELRVVRPHLLRLRHRLEVRALGAGRGEEHRGDVVRHVHPERVEGVEERLRGEPHRAGHAGDGDASVDHAALARGVREVGERVELVVVGRVVRLDDDRLEAVDGAVAVVVLVRVELLVAVDADRRERVDVVLVARLLRVLRGAVDARHAHGLAVRRRLHLVPRLPPDGLEPLRPRAPRRAEGDEHEVGRLHEVLEVLVAELRQLVGHLHVELLLLGRQHLVLDVARLLRVELLAVAGVGRHLELEDLLRHVRHRRAHHVLAVDGGELAGQPLHRDVEEDAH